MSESSPANENLIDLDLRALITSTDTLCLGITEKDPFQTVAQEMSKYPKLGEYVIKKMHNAITPEEQQLIATTALTVYRITNKLPFRELEIEGYDGPIPLSAAIAVEEDEIHSRRRDKNSIYESLQSDMADHPELAAYVAQKMSGSVSLEEANLIGEASLVVYDFIKDFGSSQNMLLVK